MSQHQAESAQALLDALTSQLQSISMQPGSQLNAVSIKLPEFWTTSPEVWFARVEAQFGTKNITQDQTRYDYVVSALVFKTAEEVQDVLVSPPEAEKYTTLKKGPHQSLWQVPGSARQRATKSQRIRRQKAYCPAPQD